MPFLAALETLEWQPLVGVPFLWTVPGYMSFFVAVEAASPRVLELFSSSYLHGFSHASIGDS